MLLAITYYCITTYFFERDAFLSTTNYMLLFSDCNYFPEGSGIWPILVTSSWALY